MDKVKVVQFGIGGWGRYFFQNAASRWPAEDYEYVGVVDPRAEQSPIYGKILEMGIPVYPSQEEFYSKNKADLAVITASIPAHCPCTVYALRHGSHVLCEKPAAGTMDEVRLMTKTSQETGKFVAISFNRCYAPASINAKEDFLAGKFGKPVRFRVRSICGRDDGYFFRNNWSGRIHDTEGLTVLDSVLCNGTSHELQHMYYMQGPAPDQSANPVSLRAELYRANAIETFDTCILQARMDTGGEVFCYVTHATDYTEFPVYDYEYEAAVLHYNREKYGDDLIAEFRDGSITHYGPAFPDGVICMEHCVRSILKGAPIPCGLDAASPHVLTVNALADYCPVTEFPKSSVIRDEVHKLSYVPNLGKKIVICYDEWCLMADKGWYGSPSVSWCSLAGYEGYYGGKFLK